MSARRMDSKKCRRRLPVIHVALSAMLQLSVLSAEAVVPATLPAKSASLTYVEAYRASQAEDKPLVVLVGADWCPACQTMKKSSMPQVANDGVFKEVAFTVVDTDKQGDIAREIMQGGSIPQLVMFHKTADGWRSERLVGGQSPSNILAFIRRGVRAAGKIVN